MYKISEFAKLCNVSRATLIYYDKIGLLSPQITGENGYRYYTIEQHQKYSIIAILIEAGASLDEIKEFLNFQDRDKLISILDEKKKVLEDNMKKLHRMDYLLTDTIETLKNIPDKLTGSDPVHIESQGEEYLIAVDANVKKAQDYNRAMVTSIGNLCNYLFDNRIAASMHIGEIVLKKDAEKGDLIESLYFSRIPERIEDEHLIVKPAGIYATMYHHGHYLKLGESYRFLMDYIQKKNYKLIGNIYEEDIIDYISETDPDKYVSRISAHIKI